MNAYEITKDEQEYEDMLNDTYGTVDICGMTFDQGTVLKELDPTAFRCGLADEEIQYGCGECDTVYDEEDEAEECCKEEEPEEEEEEMTEYK